MLLVCDALEEAGYSVAALQVREGMVVVLQRGGTAGQGGWGAEWLHCSLGVGASTEWRHCRGQGGEGWGGGGHAACRQQLIPQEGGVGGGVCGVGVRDRRRPGMPGRLLSWPPPVMTGTPPVMATSCHRVMATCHRVMATCHRVAALQRSVCVWGGGRTCLPADSSTYSTRGGGVRGGVWGGIRDRR